MGNLAEWDFDLVDCQVHTDHLERFGACRVKRASFLARLHESLEKPTRRGPWRLPLGPAEALERLQRS